MTQFLFSERVITDVTLNDNLHSHLKEVSPDPYLILFLLSSVLTSSLIFTLICQINLISVVCISVELSQLKDRCVCLSEHLITFI